MNYASSLKEIALRKERLIARIDSERGTLSTLLKIHERSAVWVDRGVAFVRFVKSHPALVAIGVALSMILPIFRSKRKRGWLTRGLLLWRIWRSAAPWLRRRT